MIDFCRINFPFPEFDGGAVGGVRKTIGKKGKDKDDDEKEETNLLKYTKI